MWKSRSIPVHQIKWSVRNIHLTLGWTEFVQQTVWSQVSSWGTLSIRCLSPSIRHFCADYLKSNPWATYWRTLKLSFLILVFIKFEFWPSKMGSFKLKIILSKPLKDSLSQRGPLITEALTLFNKFVKLLLLRFQPGEV